MDLARRSLDAAPLLRHFRRGLLGLLALAGAGLAGLSFPLAADELLQNGDFEQDASVDSWRVEGGGTLSLVATPSPVHHGERAARLTAGTAGTQLLSQVVAIQAGQLYTFTVYVYQSDGAIAESSLRLIWYTTLDGTYPQAGSPQDSTETLTGNQNGFRELTTGGVLAPPGARSARVQIVVQPFNPGGSVYIDDASLTGQVPFTPTPTSTATVTPTPTATSPPTDTPTASPTPSQTPTPTPSATPTATPSITPTSTPSATATATPTVTPTATSTAVPSGLVVLAEVQYDPLPAGEDARYEWCELFNTGSVPVELDGWTLSDNVASDRIPAYQLGPGASLVVAASPAFRELYPAYTGPIVFLDGAIGNGLNNQGDRLILRDPAGTTVDALSYGGDRSVLDPPAPLVAPGHSLERDPTSLEPGHAAVFRDNPSPSPGRGPDPATASPTPTPTATVTATPTTTPPPTRTPASVLWLPVVIRRSAGSW